MNEEIKVITREEYIQDKLLQLPSMIFSNWSFAELQVIGEGDILNVNYVDITDKNKILISGGKIRTEDDADIIVNSLNNSINAENYNKVDSDVLSNMDTMGNALLEGVKLLDGNKANHERIAEQPTHYSQE